MTTREKILSRVNAALAPLPRRAPLPAYANDVATLPLARQATDLVALFQARLERIGGRLFTSPTALAAWLATQNVRHGYCAPTHLSKLSAALNPYQLETTYDRSRVDDYQFALTPATAAIAETGTIILNDRDTPNRLAALTPWIHIAIVDRSTLHRDIASALSSLGADPNTIWCTGPSKTADVEGILIQGVHGPGEQIALLV